MMPMASSHSAPRWERKVEIERSTIPNPISATATPNWIRVSTAMARNRLPIPAIGNSRGMSSGVSMASLSCCSVIMITRRWLEARKSYWSRLEHIIERSGRRGVASIPYQELQELALLYRQVAADLASVREDPSSRRLSEYLNRLLAMAHNLIYMGRRSSSPGILTFYRSVFPAVFRENLDYFAVAAIVFATGVLVGFLASLVDPSFQRFFLGPAMSATIDRREMWTHSIVAIKPLAASGIMTNNLTVSFAAFAFGITAGLGTLYLLLANGLLMGVISAACWQAGMSFQLWE